LLARVLSRRAGGPIASSWPEERCRMRPKHKLTTDRLTCDNGQRAGDDWLDCGVRFHQLRTYREVGPRPRWANCRREQMQQKSWQCLFRVLAELM
jgi:hypothetical protein